MSNLIKYPFVNFQSGDKKTISYEKPDPFVPLKKSSRVIVRSAAEVEAEEAKREAEKELNGGKQESAEGEFTPGVSVENIDDIVSKKVEEADETADKILTDAESQAAQIIQAAEDQAEAVREAAREEGLSSGREEGLARAQEELDSARRELEETRVKQEEEYRKMLEEVEPRYAEILCSLLQKLTGVLVSDRQDVLLYLIRNSIEDMPSSKNYIIRLSTEDLVFAESHRDEILAKTGADVNLEFREEKGLEKDECIIETDTQMANCGFRIQLENMISTIRMLAQ